MAATSEIILQKKLTNSQDEMDQMKVMHVDDLVRFKDQQKRMALQNESFCKSQNIVLKNL